MHASLYVETWIWGERVAEKHNPRANSLNLNPEDWIKRPLLHPHGGWSHFNPCGQDPNLNPIGMP